MDRPIVLDDLSHARLMTQPDPIELLMGGTQLGID